jgi:hypothetical protein
MFFIIGFFCSNVVFAQNGAFDLLNGQHEAHSTAYKMQDFTGTSLGAILLKSGYTEDGTGGWEHELQQNRRLVVQCKIINGNIQTTILLTPANASEQQALFNSIVDEFIQVLGRRPVSSTAGMAREWKGTSYGDIRVMIFARYVTFSMTDI